MTDPAQFALASYALVFGFPVAAFAYALCEGAAALVGWLTTPKWEG